LKTGLLLGVGECAARLATLIEGSVAERIKKGSTRKNPIAVTNGQDPYGTQMSADMPHWTISNEDLSDLIAYLKTLP
jgi:hypothetical protein